MTLTRRELLTGAAGALLLPLLPGPARGAAPGTGAPLLAVAEGPDPGRATLAAVEGLGGMARFVRPGARVVLKPNIGWDRTPEQGANTHPEVVRALCGMCLGAGAASVLIFDRTCNDARRCYRTSGMEAMVESLGESRVRLEFINQERFRPVDIPRGEALTRALLYGPALDADLLINVPVAKHHSISGLTLGMKNLMGVLGGNRGSLHGDIGRKLADLATVVRPALTVLDATRVMFRNGPTGGRLEDVRAVRKVAACADIVALDAWGTTLFGLTPAELPSVVEGSKRGLGVMDLSRVTVRELRA